MQSWKILLALMAQLAFANNSTENTTTAAATTTGSSSNSTTATDAATTTGSSATGSSTTVTGTTTGGSSPGGDTNGTKAADRKAANAKYEAAIETKATVSIDDAVTTDKTMSCNFRATMNTANYYAYVKAYLASSAKTQYGCEEPMEQVAAGKKVKTGKNCGLGYKSDPTSTGLKAGGSFKTDTGMYNCENIRRQLEETPASTRRLATEVTFESSPQLRVVEPDNAKAADMSSAADDIDTKLKAKYADYVKEANNLILQGKTGGADWKINWPAAYTGAGAFTGAGADQAHGLNSKVSDGISNGNFTVTTKVKKGAVSSSSSTTSGATSTFVSAAAVFGAAFLLA